MLNCVNYLAKFGYTKEQVSFSCMAECSLPALMLSLSAAPYLMVSTDSGLHADHLAAELLSMRGPHCWHSGCPQCLLYLVHPHCNF